MASEPRVRPVETLRELVTSLEAALTVVAARPKAKNVHHLRTTTRRIEAEMELLTLLPGMGEQSKAGQESVQRLGKLRRTAGKVRDLDVQRKLTQSGEGSQSKDARQLRKALKQRRGDREEELLREIEKQRNKLSKSLEALLDALDAAKPPALSTERLARLVCRWYTHNSPATAEGTEQMHAVRKAAKMARYMAESGADGKGSRLARTFEEVQQAGGRWHDWLTLAEVAREELGDSSPLAKVFDQRCKRALTMYKRRLRTLPEALSGATE